jgi:hypothetical protein
MTADKKSKSGSARPKWIKPTVKRPGLWETGKVLAGLSETEFAEARSVLQHHDRRRVTDRQRFLKAEALKRGWWVPRGVNDEYRMHPAWEQYYEQRLREPEPPDNLTDVDRHLLAKARIMGIQPVPLAHQLTDEWRDSLWIECRISVAVAAIREFDAQLFNPPPPPKQRGKTKGAWNKQSPKTQDPAVVKRRTDRRAKATRPNIKN